jgi:AraC-like DNA-binding protein
MLGVPLVPTSYVMQLMELLEARGVRREPVLAGAGIAVEVLEDPRARIALEPLIKALALGAELAGDPALGIELGLAMKPSSHSWFGYALMSAPTVREACEIGVRFMGVRVSPWRARMFTEGDTAVMEFEDNHDLGAARILALECFLAGALSLAEFLHGETMIHPDFEFCADYPEQEYHARFAGRFPRVRYGCAKLQARHPAAWLDRRLVFAETVANREAVQALDGELRLIANDDWVQRTRGLLEVPDSGSLDLDGAAKRLGLSSRTLRRQLQLRETTFHELRDEVRRTRATELLARSELTLEAIALELGYSGAPAFSRAFERWTGAPPSCYRKRYR